MFLGEDKVDNEISGDADRCLRVDVVATFVVFFAIVTSSSSKRSNGDGVRLRCPTTSSSAKSNSVGRFRVDVVSIIVVCEDNEDDSMMIGDNDDSCGNFLDEDVIFDRKACSNDDDEFDNDGTATFCEYDCGDIDCDGAVT